MKQLPKLTTSITRSDEKTIWVRGKNLVEELIGHATYTEMVYFLTTARMPMPAETRVLDACLVTLMEHGLTPSAIIARMLADNVPGEAQVAIAGGLLAVGGVFVGTMEGCARILQRGVADGADPAAFSERTVAEYGRDRTPLPGFGHRLHKPDDPRAQRLLQLAEELGFTGPYVRLLRALGAALDRASGKHVTINATGAIGALLLEIGIPVQAMRAMAVVSRAGGLPGHLIENESNRSGRRIWRLVDDSIPYKESTPADVPA